MPYKLAGRVGKYLSFIQRESDQKRLTYQEVVDAMNQTEAEREPVIRWVSCDRDAVRGAEVDVWGEEPSRTCSDIFHGGSLRFSLSAVDAAALGINIAPGECFRFDLANRRRAK